MTPLEVPKEIAKILLTPAQPTSQPDAAAWQYFVIFEGLLVAQGLSSTFALLESHKALATTTQPRGNETHGST